MGVLVSVLLHGLVLSLQFGIPGLRPGPGGPVAVRLTPAPAAMPASEPDAPAPLPVPPPAAALPAPPVPLPQELPRAARHGFTLVDPVAPAPVPAAPLPERASPPRRVVKRRPKVPAARAADGLHTRVIAQETHLDNTFDVPLPAIEPGSVPDPRVRTEATAEADKPAEPDATSEEEARAGRARLADERERDLQRDAGEAPLRAQAEEAMRAEATREQQRLAAQSAEFEATFAARQRQADEERARLLADQRAADEAQARSRQDEEERRLAAQQRIQQAERERAQQLAERQRTEQAERERAQQLAERQRIEQAERERAQQLAERQRIEQADRERAQQLAEQRRAEEAVRQQLAEQERTRQLAEERARQARAQQAEENARLAREQALRDRERDASGTLAAAPGPARTGAGANGAGDGAGRGNGTLPRAALGSDVASRAREMLRGIDILKSVPQAVRPAEDAARAVRRALADAARHDIPLRMYIDSVRQKIERNAVLSEAQLSADVVRTDPIVSVAIRSDGSVEDVIILRSSGRADIDEFVRRIVRLNARYSAFPPNVAANYDVIELRRVWRFAGVLRLLEEMR
jgi:hypothetical protein